MRCSRAAFTLVETLAALVAAAIMVAFAFRAFAQLEGLRAQAQRGLDRDLARDRALANLARDLEDLAHEAPARAPAATVVAVELGSTATLVLDAGHVRWRVAAGQLYRGDVLALASVGDWRVYTWHPALGRFVEPTATISYARDDRPERLKVSLDGHSLERDLR